ncbi:MAG TPA: DinB family protein [Bryobacteraceae bacterium]|nr:DinB family protein [Bryobacteraceae bacterium]
MTRYLVMSLALTGLCVLQAQTENPLSTEVKGSYTNVKNNLLKAADKVSEADYAFKATAEVRPFGTLVGHVADSNLRTCSAINGEAKQGTASSKTSKADLVAALKESFAECDKAYDSLTDADATKMISMGRMQRSKLGALWGTVVHDNEMYGTMAVYMRLKGLVPPSTEGRAAGR